MNTRVSAIIINGNSEVLLMHRIKNNEEYFVLPGGGIENGETENDAVIRETKEETNLVIKPDKIIFEFYNDAFDRKEIFFKVKSFVGNLALGGPELSRQSKDNIYKLEWVKIKDLQNFNLLPKKIIQVIQNSINNRE